MPQGSVRELLPARADRVFALLHDYDRRLEWDTLLCEAYLTEGWSQAHTGAIAVCRGRRRLGGMALKTVYVTFVPGRVAAVKMINRPPFIDSFAATIRHEDREDNSDVEYKFNFTARPRWLRWLLHPVMARIFTWETKRRLAALRTFLILDRAGRS
jgi:hypothetical protein